jgi:hypothetical protein
MDGLLITAAPEELKSFAERYASDPTVFSHPEDFARHTDEDAGHRARHPLSWRTESSNILSNSRESSLHLGCVMLFL